MVICPQDCYLNVRSLGDRDLIPIDKKLKKTPENDENER
jgi:hypothetical protein